MKGDYVDMIYLGFSKTSDMVLWGFKVIYVVCWLHSVLSYSYPTLSCWFSFLDMKAVKELYEMKKIVKDKRYFSFISGFNNHSVGEEILPEDKWNGRIFQSRC